MADEELHAPQVSEVEAAGVVLAEVVDAADDQLFHSDWDEEEAGVVFTDELVLEVEAAGVEDEPQLPHSL